MSLSDQERAPASRAPLMLLHSYQSRLLTLCFDDCSVDGGGDGMEGTEAGGIERHEALSSRALLHAKNVGFILNRPAGRESNVDGCSTR